MANGGYWGGIGGKFAQSGAGQITFGTISGGAGAALSGGNFWEGAAIGFVVSTLNHAFHDGFDKNGRKINNNGGDEIDYMYDDDGNIIASTAVEIQYSKTSERSFRFYGLKMTGGGGGLYDPTWDILGGALPVGKLFSSFRLLFGVRVVNTIPQGKLANHLFKGTNKLVDNPTNRSLITKISNGKPLVVDKFGKSWYRGVSTSGRGIYSYTQNGIVKGAGYTNLSAAEIVTKYGIK